MRQRPGFHTQWSLAHHSLQFSEAMAVFGTLFFGKLKRHVIVIGQRRRHYVLFFVGVRAVFNARQPSRCGQVRVRVQAFYKAIQSVQSIHLCKDERKNTREITIRHQLSNSNLKVVDRWSLCIVPIHFSFLPPRQDTMAPPMIAGTLQTDPRSGGLKRSSGVNVLPEVKEAWEEVRNDKNADVDWIMCGYVANSKTDITVLHKGNGGVAACAAQLPDAEPVFGGIRLPNGRFTGFYYVGETCSAMKKGRASMHKNGVLNVLEGRDGEMEIKPDMAE